MIDFPASPTIGQQFTVGGVTWTWDGTKWAASGLSTVFLPLSGGIMTGGLTLNANPTTNLGAATKQYVDSGFLPLAGGTISPGPLRIARAGSGPYPALYFNNDSLPGTNSIYAQSNGVTRWLIQLSNNTAESGNNAGSDFAIYNSADNGLNLGNPLLINRATGVTTLANLSAPQAIGDNRIINGDCRVDQRNNGAAGTAINVYTVDRWRYVAAQAAKGTWQRIATLGPPYNRFDFPYALQFTSSSAYTPLTGDAFGFQQSLEADMISDFGWGTNQAQPVTLSFWVQSSLTGTFGGALQNVTGTTRSYPFSYSISAANTWTYVSVTIPGDTTPQGWVLAGNAASLCVNFDLGSGSQNRAAAGAWAATPIRMGVTGAVNVVATSGATFWMTGIKLEVGPVATPFNRQSMARSMADCQRYYEAGPTTIWSGNVTSASGYYLNTPFQTQKRAVPTMTVAAAFTNLSFPAGPPTVGTTTVGGFNTSLAANASGAAYFQFSWTANAEL